MFITNAFHPMPSSRLKKKKIGLQEVCLPIVGEYRHRQVAPLFASSFPLFHFFVENPNVGYFPLSLESYHLTVFFFSTWVCLTFADSTLALCLT